MDRKNIKENNLDALLNKLFLEENAAEFQENTAEFVLKQSYAPIMTADKEQKLIQKLNKKLKGPNGFWNYSIVFFVVIFTMGAFLYSKYETRKAKDVKRNAIKNRENKLQERTLAPTDFRYETIRSASEKINDSGLLTVQEKQTNTYNLKKLSNGASVYPVTGAGSKSIVSFFKPTEQDVIFFDLYKKAMLENLLYTDKEMYSVVEQGTVNYQGNPLSVAPFILRNYTITNLEYKIFLAELIKEKKEEDFKKATVKNEIWIDYNDNILASTYFFEEKYNNFPVVNISSEAAALFCLWLETEINLYSKQINSQAEPMKIRLPLDAELLLAEKNGYLDIPNCNGYQTIYDRKHAVEKSTNKNNKWTALNDMYLLNRYGMDENKTLQLFERGFSYTGKSVATATNQTGIEVFSKVAHVSEIVGEQGSNRTKVAGTCWKTKQDYINMTKAFEKAGASPFVGFRVVIVYGEH